MAVSPLDDEILGPLFVSDEVRALFSTGATLATYLEVEAALAWAQAEHGLIPTEAADAIARVRPSDLDRSALGARALVVGFPVAGLVEQLADVAAAGLGQYAHWGATTQDVMDTALVLQLRRALRLVDRDLLAAGREMAALADRHRRSVMVGRSQLQPAAPTTFGLRAAGWLGAVTRHLHRLDELAPRLGQVELGGAVGTLAAMGPDALAVRRAMAARLGLGSGPVAWHTARDALVEVGSVCAGVAASLGKVGADVALGAQFEVGELAEAPASGRGISSTMPQKRNPVAAQSLLHAARFTRAQVGSLLDAAVADHDRGTGVAALEWTALVPLVAVTATAAGTARELLAGLVVDVERMRRNVDDVGHGLVAEAVMMHLAPRLGRQRAHDRVADAVREAAASARPLVDVLAEAVGPVDPEVLDPARYLGATEGQIDDALAAFARARPESGGPRADRPGEANDDRIT